MRKFCACMAITAALLTGAASAAGPVLVNGVPIEAGAKVRENTTYVSLRAVTEALRPDGTVTWESGRAVVRASNLTLTARPGDAYIEAGDRVFSVPGGVQAENGRTLVPVRVLAAALGGTVDWNPSTGVVNVTGDTSSGDVPYDGDAVYWLSRIISAESRGEPLEGKIAVGNVILNRVADAGFPDTIYGVIFDGRWGGQFEPVRNGTIYDTPTEESVLAAKLCLEGANTAGKSLYFLAPALTSNRWIMENRDYETTIGSHWFYR